MKVDAVFEERFWCPDAGAQQLGWVPRETAPQIAAELDAGTTWSAPALRESRASPRDPRSGLTMLLARAPRIELVERPRGRGY